MLPYRKKKPCKFFAQGHCKNPNCQFLHTERGGPKTDVLVTMLTLLFEKQRTTIYDPESGKLFLNNFRECEDLARIQGSINFNTKAFCDALCEVIQATIGLPTHLVLDNNGIGSLVHILTSLKDHDLHVSLRGLSARNNAIATVDFINQLKHFPVLYELMLIDNPVTQVHDYRRLVRQGLPTVQGLDGESIAIVPLSMPWPIKANYDDEAMAILTFLERNVFDDTINRLSIDYYRAIYGEEALFSLVIDEGAALVSPQLMNVPRPVVKAFAALRTSSNDRNRNMLSTGIGTSKVVRGPIDISSTFRHCLYPEQLCISHHLDGNASLHATEAGLKIVTVHGKMCWSVSGNEHSPALTRVFVRTFSLLPCGNGFFIQNDMLQLLCHRDAPVFDPLSESRIAAISRKSGLHPALVHYIFSSSGNDSEAEGTMALLINDFGCLTLNSCVEAVALCQVDMSVVSTLAATVKQHGVDPATALAGMTL